jgi:hypothetical protein
MHSNHICLWTLLWFSLDANFENSLFENNTHSHCLVLSVSFASVNTWINIHFYSYSILSLEYLSSFYLSSQLLNMLPGMLKCHHLCKFLWCQQRMNKLLTIFRCNTILCLKCIYTHTCTKYIPMQYKHHRSKIALDRK